MQGVKSVAFILGLYLEGGGDLKPPRPDCDLPPYPYLLTGLEAKA